MPEAGGLGEVSFAGLDEEGLVFAGGDDLAGQVVGKLRNEDRVGELFEEDRGEIEVAVEADVVALEVFEDAEKREVGLGSGLVEPLHAVGPGTVIDDVRQVCVQGEGQESCRAGRCFGRCVRHDGVPHMLQLALPYWWVAGCESTSGAQRLDIAR
jgi:hypothetical protein